VYLPEAPFEMESFIPAVEDAIATHGWSVVVVSEGIRYADGRMVYQKLDPAQADPLNRPLTGGVGQYLADEVAAHLGIRCRCEKPGLLGRSSALHASCQDRKDAEVVGRAGVRGLLENRTSQMVSLLPLQGAGEARYTFAGLDEAAGIERQIPAEWVGEGAIPLKPEFFEYLRPLAGELIPYHAPISSELDFHGDA
ncbi:MAG: hypothetical protein ACRD34_16600, partial [Bryobacteraceae bacterium]